MRPYVLPLTQHVTQRRGKYLILCFVFLTGCMTGYYAMDGISSALAASIQTNLQPRFLASGADIGAILLAVCFAGTVWLCGLSPAGIVLVPLLLLTNACAQVFVFRIVLLDTDFGGGMLGALCVAVLFFWSAACLFLCESALENALEQLRSRAMRLPYPDRPVDAGRRAQSYGVAAVVYALCSWLIFLLDRAIF